MEKAGRMWSIVTSHNCGQPTDPSAGCLFNSRCRISLSGFAESLRRENLFAVKTDPTEHNDIAKEFPHIAAQMKARVLELTPSLFNPNRCHPCKHSSSLCVFSSEPLDY